MPQVLPLSQHNLLLHTTVGVGFSEKPKRGENVRAWAENVARLFHARQKAALPSAALASLTLQDTFPHPQTV